MALEPGPFDARLAPQPGRREQDEPEQEGGRTAADELHPPRGDRVGLAQRQ